MKFKFQPVSTLVGMLELDALLLNDLTVAADTMLLFTFNKNNLNWQVDKE